MNINEIAKRAYKRALERGKITEVSSPTAQYAECAECAESLKDEFCELLGASEDTSSEHLSEYSEVQEEITDILIVCLTELYRRNDNVERIIMRKIDYNDKRID